MDIEDKLEKSINDLKRWYTEYFYPSNPKCVEFNKLERKVHFTKVISAEQSIKSLTYGLR